MNTATPDLGRVSRLPLPAGDPDADDNLDAALIEARQYLQFYDWGKAIKANISDMVPRG
jgi:hypothetical protein